MRTEILFIIWALLVWVGLVLFLAVYSEVKKRKRLKEVQEAGIIIPSWLVEKPKPEFLVEIMGDSLWAARYEIQEGLYGGASDIYDSIKAGNGFYTEESANSYERVFIGSKLLAEATLIITKLNPDEAK